MSVCRLDDSPWCTRGTCKECDGARPKPSAAAAKSTARRFTLVREEDVSGTSGTGVVAEGVEFSNGMVTLHWLSQLESLEMCSNVKTLMAIHGHEGRTMLVWTDE